LNVPATNQSTNLQIGGDISWIRHGGGAVVMAAAIGLFVIPSMQKVQAGGGASRPNPDEMQRRDPRLCHELRQIHNLLRGARSQAKRRCTGDAGRLENQSPSSCGRQTRNRRRENRRLHPAPWRRPSRGLQVAAGLRGDTKSRQYDMRGHSGEAVGQRTGARGRLSRSGQAILKSMINDRARAQGLIRRFRVRPEISLPAAAPGTARCVSPGRRPRPPAVPGRR